MRMLLAGGGTGGHLFPAVALAQRLLEQDAEAKVLFVGTERGIEARMLPELGLPLQTIDIRGLVGKDLGAKLALAPKLAKSLAQSRGIIKSFRPDVVVGVGGYASGPVLIMAQMMSVPTLIHEQNAWPGLTNRMLARWADRVCLSFPEADRAFHLGRTMLTGNPLRRGMDDCPPLPKGAPRLLVFGGSQGARAINDALLEALPLLEELNGKLKIVHQTGDADCERITAGYRDAGWKDVEVVPFIRDMATAYADAHLVVSRAGATTIAELTACGRPALLIPYPHAAGGHQAANAESLARNGAAMLLPQAELGGGRFAGLLRDLLHDRELLERMSRSAASMGRRGAADTILKECRRLAGKG
ncbi:MAG: undecaprenyldiphospho-muramoylpentapeptide beta-N-acetylglucosaminyltransferase [Desulfuromonas sp.]|nr:MAG: undecaprenyldiphospho-muramoylpentapeptide beta-N-acetylglucosaminyltransferase [Desulfuromonas sp.]